MSHDKDEAPRNRVGRPNKILPTEDTKRMLSGLGQIQATTKEGAAFFSVTEQTFITFLQSNPDCRQVFEDGKAKGLTSLRRSQFRLAEKNAAMAIFLGKNYLGQSDRYGMDGTVDVVLKDTTTRDRAKAMAALVAKQVAAKNG